MGCDGETAGDYHFALVSYIPGRLADFLDQLRFELKPGCVLRSHVTVLPPRPNHLNVDDCVRRIKAEVHDTAPFRVELGSVSIFDNSNVVYLTLLRGAPELRALHKSLNSGQLEYYPQFPYHPHITLAQDLSCEEGEALAKIAGKRWASYDGPRHFCVDAMDFVRSKVAGAWDDLAHVELMQPVATGR